MACWGSSDMGHCKNEEDRLVNTATPASCRLNMVVWPGLVTVRRVMIRNSPRFHHLVVANYLVGDWLVIEKNSNLHCREEDAQVSDMGGGGGFTSPREIHKYIVRQESWRKFWCIPSANTLDIVFRKMLTAHPMTLGSLSPLFQ